ncbi:MAG: diguanylate cyclase [Chloroflexi bacterium]|nr:diguanylate cyclase [Chloroflexota bacterium]
MLLQFSPYAIAFFITGGLFILISIRILDRRNSSRRIPLFFMLTAIAVWNLSSGMEMISQSLPAKISWSKFEYLGSAAAAPLLLIFCLEYTRNTKLLTRRNIFLLFIVPLVILGFVITNERHKLIWTEITPSPAGYNLYVYHHGILFWVYVAYNYLLVLAAVITFVRAFKQIPKTYQPHLIGLLIGIFIPCVASILYSFNVNPIPGFDIPALSFSLTGLVIYWFMIRYHLFDIVPLARQTLIENLSDGVLVLDEFDRIIDINPAAQKIFSITEPVIGEYAENALPNWQEFEEYLDRVDDSRSELFIKSTPPKYTSICVTNIKNQKGEVNGKIISLRDITEQKRTELALSESERKYRSIFENSQVGIFRSEISSGKILECNDHMAQILGFANREALLEEGFTTLEHYVVPEDRSRIINDLIDGEIENVEIQFLRRDQTPIILDFSLRIFPDFGYIEGIASDITERKRTEAAEREQRLMAESLQDIAKALNSTLNLDEVLDRILENIGCLLPFNTVDVLMLDENHQEAHIVRCAGYENFSKDNHISILNLKLNLETTKNLRTVYQTRQPLLIDNVATFDWISTPQTSWIQSNLCAPIIIKDKVEGFLSLSSNQSHFFKPEHAEYLQAFADQSAIAIQNARLFTETQRHTDQISALYRIGQTLNLDLEIDQILSDLYDQCKIMLPMDIFYVAVYEEQTHLLHHPLFVEHGQQLTIYPRDIRLQPGLTGEVIYSQKTIYLPDTLSPGVEAQHHIIHTGGKPSRSYVGVPLIVRGKVVGVISMQSYQANAYNSEQIHLFETIANQAGIVIQNANLFQEMKQMAVTDSLTQLYNRRFTEITLETEFKRCERYNTDLTIGFFDIDDFKQINDRFGHACGDVVLKIVAEHLNTCTRFVDFSARIGGDEFLIIFPHTKLDDAWIVLKRLQENLRQCIISCTGEFITISGGVTSWLPGDKPEDILIRADDLMYQAKRLGKNQIIKDIHL